MYTQSFIAAARANHARPPANRMRDTAHAYYQEAMTFIRNRESRKAIGLLKEGVQDFPEDFQLRYHLGRECLIEGQTTNAERNLLKARELEPEDVQTLFELGRLYTKVKQHKTAEEQFFQALNIQLQDPVTFYGLGVLYKKANGALYGQEHEQVLARGCFGFGHEIADPARAVSSSNLNLMREMRALTGRNYTPGDAAQVLRRFNMWESSQKNDPQKFEVKGAFE